MDGIVNHLGSLASLVGSLTVVGGALIWLYNKFIGAPREARRERDEAARHARMIELVTKENQPLNESIKQLTLWLDESRVDRVNLNKIANGHTVKIGEHETRLDNHNDRLIVIEAKNGIYGGGENKWTQ